MQCNVGIIKVRGAVKKFPDFLDTAGLVHRESVPPGQSVTVRVLQRKRRDKWQAGTVVSAPSHTPPRHRTLRISHPVAGRDSGFCTEPHTTQPPYYPDLARSDFWLFPALKMGPKGNVTAELQKIPT
jgi:hypothetical protein